MAAAIVELIRPRQWTKNLAVFAALIFSRQATDPHSVLIAVFAFLLFDATTGGLYALNDAADADRDRLHPEKRNRPVASGRVSVVTARVLGAVLITGALVGSWFIAPAFFGLVAGYVVLQLAYVRWLKHVSIVDMLVIAMGFVMRAVAGAAAIAVPVSPWLALCTGLLALFLAAAKRRHELLVLGEDAAAHRSVLGEYSAELLDSFMVTLSAATITSYALYTFYEESSPGYAMMLTIPFVIYGVLRYQQLVLREDAGGKPEDVLLGDKPIIIDIVLWVACAIIVLYVLPFVQGRH